MAPDQTTQQSEWTKRKENALAEKAALDAEKELLEARKALEAAKAPVDPAKKRLEEQLAALKEAESLSNAKLAAFKASLGEVTASGIAGDITVGAKTGAAESALLASKAVEEAADAIESRLGLPQRATVILYPAKEVPDFQTLMTYRAQIAPLRAALSNAQEKSQAADNLDPQQQTAPDKAAFPMIAAAGLTLDAITKLLGYFKSDYSMDGVDVTQDDSLLLHAIAGRLVKNTTLTVQLPGLYHPKAGDSLLDEVRDLSEQRSQSFRKAGVHEQRAGELTAKASAETDPEALAELQQRADSHRAAATALREAVTAYDTFFDKLTAADEKGLIPLAQVLRDNSVMKALEDGGYLLLVRIQASGGSYYTQKNLGTIFGGVPIYHMGGVVTSFVLLEGSSGKVLSAGVVPIHGGFFRARKVKKALAPQKAGWLRRLLTSDSEAGSEGAAGARYLRVPTPAAAASLKS